MRGADRIALEGRVDHMVVGEVQRRLAGAARLIDDAVLGDPGSGLPGRQCEFDLGLLEFGPWHGTRI